MARPAETITDKQVRALFIAAHDHDRGHSRNYRHLVECLEGKFQPIDYEIDGSAKQQAKLDYDVIKDRYRIVLNPYQDASGNPFPTPASANDVANSAACALIGNMAPWIVFGKGGLKETGGTDQHETYDDIVKTSNSVMKEWQDAGRIPASLPRLLDLAEIRPSAAMSDAPGAPAGSTALSPQATASSSLKRPWPQDADAPAEPGSGPQASVAANEALRSMPASKRIRTEPAATPVGGTSKPRTPVISPDQARHMHAQLCGDSPAYKQLLDKMESQFGPFQVEIDLQLETPRASDKPALNQGRIRVNPFCRDFSSDFNFDVPDQAPFLFMDTIVRKTNVAFAMSLSYQDYAHKTSQVQQQFSDPAFIAGLTPDHLFASAKALVKNPGDLPRVCYASRIQEHAQAAHRQMAAIIRDFMDKGLLGRGQAPRLLERAEMDSDSFFQVTAALFHESMARFDRDVGVPQQA